MNDTAQEMGEIESEFHGDERRLSRYLLADDLFSEEDSV